MGWTCSRSGSTYKIMIDVDFVLGPLNSVDVYGVADLSEVRSASVFRV
jgi:hypothetical protein